MRKEDPLVSVVLPTYGRSEKFIAAVRSVVDQTYDGIELVIVDDASPVPVEERVSQLQLDSLATVQVIRHEQNRGANVARNSGIDAATGSLIAFLDDDDQWAADKIRRQVAVFEDAGPETGVVYTWARHKGPRGMSVKTPDWRGNVTEKLLSGKNFGQFSSVMVRADIIDAAGYPDERFPVWQDREWFLRLAQYCHFEPVTEPLTVRTVGHDDQISGNYEEKRDVAYPLFLEKHRELAAEHGFRYERLFLATLRFSLAKTAIRCQRYEEARKYFALAFLAYPTYNRCYVPLLATIGGGVTYSLAQTLNERLSVIQRKVTNNVSN
jgi:glycosyltransferase involved in cell wall biosynthesis